ncbi:hypothetical protein G9A89_006832 [Geosiphon pyriformis]|nr:hypothetical protein G9A89_006832 [Geosiphon pyriformis]
MESKLNQNQSLDFRKRQDKNHLNGNSVYGTKSADFKTQEDPFDLEIYLEKWKIGLGNDNKPHRKAFAKGFTKSKLYLSPEKDFMKMSEHQKNGPLTPILKNANLHPSKFILEDTPPRTPLKYEDSQATGKTKKSVRFSKLPPSPIKIITRAHSTIIKEILSPPRSQIPSVVKIDQNEDQTTDLRSIILQSELNTPLIDQKENFICKKGELYSTFNFHDNCDPSFPLDNMFFSAETNSLGLGQLTTKEPLSFLPDKIEHEKRAQNIINLSYSNVNKPLKATPLSSDQVKPSIISPPSLGEKKPSRFTAPFLDEEKPLKFTQIRGKRFKEKMNNKKPGPDNDLPPVLEVCKQANLYSFQEFLGIECLEMAKKVGESTFAEVYEIMISNFTTNNTKCVLKIIPFGRGKEVLVNGEEQCTTLDVLQEIKITMELGGQSKHNLGIRTGFLKVYRIGICCGKYPQMLIKAWDEWDKHHVSENDRPDYFDENQNYAVFVLEHGGIDLEKYKLKDWRQAWSVLVQIGWTLALAEESLKFEHRDLHLGNITIKETSKSHIISFCDLANGKEYQVPCFGLKAYIIDYTLSRMDIDNEIVHVDIKDEGYFTGEGDYQYDIYRMMLEETNGNWKAFCPKTNVSWLHHLADKLLTAMNLEKPKKRSKPQIANQLRFYSAIQGLRQRALKGEGYKSAKDLMEKDPFWKI